MAEQRYDAVLAVVRDGHPVKDAAAGVGVSRQKAVLVSRRPRTPSSARPRSPTTTGKIKRFHRTLRAEFDTSRTFSTLASAQGALDEWVGYDNTERPHRAIDFATPQVRFEQRPAGATGLTIAVEESLPVVRTAPGTAG